MVSRVNFFGMSRARHGDVGSEMQSLRRDLQRVRNDVGDLAAALVDTGRDGADSARQNVQRQAQRIGSAYEVARQRGGRAVDTMAERPMASIAIAFAAGLVIAGFVALSSMLRR